MTKITKAALQAKLDQLKLKNRDRVRAFRARKAAAKAKKVEKEARSLALQERRRTLLLEKRKKAARAKKRLELCAFRIQADKDRREKLDAFIVSKTN